MEEQNTMKNRGILALKDQLSGCLIGLARACTSNPRDEITDRALVEGLAGSLYLGQEDEERFLRLLALVRQAKDHAAPGCALCTARCGNTDDYDMDRMWNGPEETRTIKTLLLYSLEQMAALIWPAMKEGEQVEEEILSFFYRALFMLAEDWDSEYLMSAVMDAGKINRLCMAWVRN